MKLHQIAADRRLVTDMNTTPMKDLIHPDESSQDGGASEQLLDDDFANLQCLSNADILAKTNSNVLKLKDFGDKKSEIFEYQNVKGFVTN